MPQVITVGYNQQFPSIQHAINHIVNIVAATASGLLPDSFLIEVYEGIYGGFIIPSSSIGATATNTLLVKARTNSRVTLSGLVSNTLLGHGYRTVGIGIGDNNPYISVKGLIVERFHKGLVVGGACHNTKITHSLFRLNSNVGVWIYRSDRCQVVNNVILDHDNCLAVTEVNDILIAHNDIVNITSVQGSTQQLKYNIHITTRNTNTYSPNGTIILYNNNIVGNGGALIGYGNNVLPKLRSDNNNLYNPGGVVGKAVNPAIAVPDSPDLSTWQTVSNNDQASISVPSDYYIGTQAGNSVYTAILLGNYMLFGGVGRGIMLCGAQTASTTSSPFIPHGILPHYTDTTLMCDTVQSNFASAAGTTALTRSTTSPPSIGAYDVAFDPYGFASNLVAPVGGPGSGTSNPNCQGGLFTSINTVEEKFDQSVDCTNPSFTPGFFYIHDIQHYLYSSKVCKKLSDITVSDYTLAAELRDIPSDGTSGIRVLFGDIELPRSQYHVFGNKLRLYHSGLDISDYDRDLIIIGTRLRWKHNTFNEETFRQHFRIRDGEFHYILPDWPTRAAPIVITDDLINYQDNPRLLGREFATIYNSGEHGVEIIFGGGTNLLQNPQFDYINTEATGLFPYTGRIGNPPANWAVIGNQQAVVTGRYITTPIITGQLISSGRVNWSGTTDGTTGDWIYHTGYEFDITSTGAINLYPVLGKNLCILTSGSLNTDGISQRVKIDPYKPYWLSLYTACVKDTGSTSKVLTGSVNVSWKWYDISHRPLSIRSNDPYSGVVSIPFTSYYMNRTGLWSRHAIAFTNFVDSTLNKIEPSGVCLVNNMAKHPITMPTGSFYTDITIGSTGVAAIDCVSFVQSLDLPQYNRTIRGNEATIEYDTGLSDLYSPHDLTITPVRNLNTIGFVYIDAVPARQYDPYANENTTTLTDWGWATGRLKYLPWARTSGKNKLRRRSNFNLRQEGVVEDIAISTDISYPEDIQIIPRVPIANMRDGAGQLDPIYRTGNLANGVYGKEFTIRVTDNHGNPYAFENVTLQLASDLDGPIGSRYIGLLGVKELGFYTQFNTTVQTKLDSAGSVVCKWIPPGADDALIEVSDPTLLNQYSIDGKTYYQLPISAYKINEAGMGNPFLSTPLRPMGYQITGDTTITDFLSPIYQGIGQTNIRAYRLSEVPHRDTVDVWINRTGDYPLASGQSISGNADANLYVQTYDLLLRQSEIPEVTDGYYFVDEPRRLLFLSYNGASNDPYKTAYVKYSPRNVFLDADEHGIVDDRRFYITSAFRNKLITEVSGGNPLSVSYDINVDLIVKAHSPTGFTEENRLVITNANPTGLTYINIRERTLNARLIGKSIPKRIDI